MTKKNGKKKSPGKQPANFKSEVTYAAWAEHFKTGIRGILREINQFEQNLTEEELDLLSVFSHDFLEKSAESPQTFGIQFQPRETTCYAPESQKQPGSAKTIVFVTGLFPGSGHGGGLRALDMIEELARKGHEVFLYTTPVRQGDESSYRHLKKLVKKIEIIEYAELNQEIFAKWISKLGKVIDAAYFVWPTTAPLLFAKHDLIREQIFEFVEVTVRRIWMDLVSYIQKREFHLVPDKLGELWMCYHWEKMAVKHATRLVCLTGKDAEFVQNVFSAKNTVVIPTGISRFVILNDLEKYKNIQPLPASAGFIGHFDHYPNKDGIRWYLENIHPHIIQQVPGYTLHLMGKGDFSALKKAFPQYSKSVKWIGEIENVVRALKKVEICITPLINGAGLRGKVNQYAALEKAFVSTSVGVCGTPYEHDRSVFIADDPLDFAQCVVRLLKDGEKRIDMSKKAKEVIRKQVFWEQSIEALEKLF